VHLAHRAGLVDQHRVVGPAAERDLHRVAGEQDLTGDQVRAHDELSIFVTYISWISKSESFATNSDESLPAAVSLVLPFLPLTAGQILLNNFLSDIPAIGIANDHVDPELVAKPRRWDTRFIGRFMVEFGLLSSAFDALTFTTLIVGFGANETMFRTGWFVESLFTELVIALVVRTQRPVWRSRPHRPRVDDGCGRGDRVRAPLPAVRHVARLRAAATRHDDHHRRDHVRLRDRERVDEVLVLSASQLEEAANQQQE
jgi:Cation transporting ATPase, C-terminus